MPKSGGVVHEAAPLRVQVVRMLRGMILEGEYRPGERLLESRLCEQLDVSRTVVREALRQLESEHLITMLPNRGPIVTVLSAHDIASIYDVRARLEGLAGERFATNATETEAAALLAQVHEMEQTYLRGTLESRDEAKAEFYRILLVGAGNDVLAEEVERIHARVGLFRHYAFVDESRVATSMEEVRRIADAAARRRDPELARHACEHHIDEAGRLAIMEHERRATGNDHIS